jgi:hypothetical protein
MSEDAAQLDLGTLPEKKAADPNVLRMILLLEERDWTTANELLEIMDEPPTESNRRKLREWANQSEGRIGSGQLGYKLVRAMTAEEFNHFRNSMVSQAIEMQRRVLLSDKVFYRKRSVKIATGVL